MTQAKSVAHQSGMTHREAREAVATVWPYLVLKLFFGSASYYKEGSFATDADTSDEAILGPKGMGSAKCPRGGPILLTGSAFEKERRDLIYTAFGLEPEFSSIHESLDWSPEIKWSSTLDELQSVIEQFRAAFAVKFGREPEPCDRFEGVTLTS